MPISELSKPYCTLICVGSELLRGKLNTHASTLARRLASIGLDLAEEHTMGDRFNDLSRMIRNALQDSSIVIVTGGLGPTFDDITREAAADALGRKLICSQKLMHGIRRKFKKARFLRMAPENHRQADLIEGARPISNRVGTAPGQWLLLVPSSRFQVSSNKKVRSSQNGTCDLKLETQKVLILLPGPPSELHPMLEESVLPLLLRLFPPGPRAEAHLHFIGVPESLVDHQLRPIIAKEKGVQFTILAHLGLVDFDIFASGSSRFQVERRLEHISGRIRRKMGRAFYGMNADYPLEKVVANAFKRAKATLAVAESCTGGMLAKSLTDIPGSSGFFSGGIVSYSNAVKSEVLGVPHAIIQKHGAVSKEVAAAMAKGVRAKLGSAWGLGITGIAGPAGGTPAKPVGLVYIGVAGPRLTRTLKFRFRGSREAIRQRSVIAALDILRQIFGRPTSRA